MIATAPHTDTHTTTAVIGVSPVWVFHFGDGGDVALPEMESGLVFVLQQPPVFVVDAPTFALKGES